MNRRGPPNNHSYRRRRPQARRNQQQPPPRPPLPPSAAPPPSNHENNHDVSLQPPPPLQQQQQQWTPHKLLTSSYKALGHPNQVKNQFTQCLLTSSKTLPSILSILLNEPGKTGIFDYSLQVDIHDFICMDPVLGNMLLRHPTALLPLLEEAIVCAQREIMLRWNDFQQLANVLNYQCDDNNNSNNTSLSASLSSPPSTTPLTLPQPVIKGENGTRVHARLIHLPPHHTNCKPSLSTLTSTDIGKILQLSGTVVRTSRVQMYESHRVYQCCPEKGCGMSFTVKAELNQWNNALNHPLRCPNVQCTNKNFGIVPEGGCRSDYQEIKVQETLSNIGMGGGGIGSSGSGGGGVSTIPRTLLIKLQHDLVDQCQPGDDVVVVGTLISHWLSNLVHMSDVQIGMAMEAHSIRVVNGNDGSGGSGGGGVDSVGGGGSSWDCIFNGNDRYDNDDEEEENNNGNDGGGNNDVKVKKRMVRDEIVREFEDYWNDDYNKNHPIAARNFICKAVCPTLYGLSMVKMSLLLVLIGGSNETTMNVAEAVGAHEKNHDTNDTVTGTGTPGQACDSEQLDNGTSEDDEMQFPLQFSLDGDNIESSVHDNADSFRSLKRRKLSDVNKTDNSATVHTRRREQSHLLLVGDPGCGKSQFLRFATALCPRSVLASGSGTTSAGLTCAAVREDNSKEWTLEAGALVLADRGVCAIDEFSCINPKDRTTIHEAMEQQTLSVAKAGIVAKLNCRATVIAVTNAKSGYYDHNKSFSTNVGIEPPLLSRFDLIFKLIDGSDVNKDDNIATFLLNRAIQGSGYDCTNSLTRSLGRKDVWGIEKLRAYLATVKSRFKPSLSDESSTLLQRHYSACRSSIDIAVQVTVRFLESLIRLAQAHASLMHRDVVQLDDAIAIIILMESSVANLTQNNYNSLGGDPTSDFPEEDYADIDFVLNKVKILENYNMQNYITVEEYRIFQNENNKVGDPLVDSWENYNNNATQSYQEVDHYGRLTQKATPSPPKFQNPTFNDHDNINQNNYNERRPPNFSAD